MPFHWCFLESEALFILLGAIPLVGLFFKKIHQRFHDKWKTLCNHDHCHEKSTKIDSSSNWTHEGSDWDHLELNDIEERFGTSIVDDLVDSKFFITMLIPPDPEEFVWLINDGTLQVRYLGRVFLREINQDGKYWIELLF